MPLTPQQHQERAHRLGGSDCAAALGLSKWKTPLQLYLEKRGELSTDREETEEQWFGKAIEPVVRQWFSERTGRTLRMPTGTLFHHEHEFMAAHIDGFSEEHGGYRGYEGKSAVRALGWGLEHTDQIPVDAFMQCQHYMIVTGFSVFDVVCLVGRRFKTYEVTADLELLDYIVEGETEFMRRVEKGDPPPLNCAHSTALDLLKRVYPGTNGKRIPATAEAVMWRNHLEEAAAAERVAKQEKNTHRAAILEAMGEAALMDFPDGKSYRRSMISKKPYTVDATSYVDSRIVNTPAR